ncbi:MAG: DUF4340 domain-containing protein [Gammaproteobacteria bacterium]|nr:DUF4340 domain-containing protein [Gammaproteobacteria bacterium]
MNAKNIGIFAAITLLAVLIAAAVSFMQPPSVSEGGAQTVFPDLISKINEVEEIAVAGKEHQFSVVRNDDGRWGLKEKHGYPAALDKVRRVLMGMAGLKTVEAKTAKPERYAKLGVEAITEADAKSIQVTLRNAGEDKLADLLVGNSRPAKTDRSLNEIYIRKPEEARSWLALGSLSIDKKPLDWLDKQIINVESKRIREIRLTQADGEKSRVYREKPEEDDYLLADLPENMKIKAAYMLKSIAGTLTNLNMDDVDVESAVDFAASPGVRAIFTSFDGLEVTLETAEKEDKQYGKFSVKYSPPAEPLQADDSKSGDDAKPEDAVKPASSEKQVREEAENLTAKLSGWAFMLPEYKINNLTKKREELMEDKTAKQTDTPGLPAAFANATTLNPANFIERLGK